MTFKMPGFSPRIDLEIIKNWGDKEISNLVLEYYHYWDDAHKNRGGLQQALGELTKLKEVIGQRKFNNFFELGVCDAGSFWLYSLMFCTPETKIVGLDVLYEPGAQLITQELYNRNRNVQYVIANCNQYVRSLTDESIDLLHIDANHDYESVKEYFDNYYPKVAKNGIILIHDTNACEGSIKFRKEILEPNYDHQLLIGDWLITGQYDIDPNIPSPGISLIRKH